MTEERQYLTIYCDEPSHTPEPVGPGVQQIPGYDPASLVHINIAGTEGVQIVSGYWRYPISRLWAPLMITARGLAKRSAGRQPEWGRYRLKCDRCDLGRTAKEPGFSDTLTALAGAGYAAVSLRTFIAAHDTQERASPDQS